MHRFGIACLLACGLLGACGSGAGSDSSESSDTSDTAEATGELIYFNPTHLPAGYKIARTDLQNDGQPDDTSWIAQVGRPVGAKKFGDVTTVLMTKSDAANDFDDKGYDPVDVNGHAGKQADSSLIGAIVSWERDGFVVSVVGPPGNRDDALGVARAVRVDPDVTETRLENLPPGMEVVAQWGSTGFPRKDYTINAEKSDPDERIHSVRISVTVVPTDLPVTVLGAGHEIDGSSKLRGHDAYVFRSANDIGGRTFEQFILTWGERDDLVITVSGDISVEEMRAIAEGLREESEQQWRTHVKVQ